MNAALALYDQFCDAETNGTQTYRLQEVAKARQEREELHNKITELNNSMDHPHVDSYSMVLMQQQLDGMKIQLKAMDLVLVAAEYHANGYLVMKRLTTEEWRDMEPIVYINDEYEARDAVTFFNAHDIVTGAVPDRTVVRRVSLNTGIAQHLKLSENDDSSFILIAQEPAKTPSWFNFSENSPDYLKDALRNLQITMMRVNLEAGGGGVNSQKPRE